MLNGKGFKCVGMVLPFVAAYINVVTGYKNESPLTKICTCYKPLMIYDKKQWDCQRRRFWKLERKLQLEKKQYTPTFQKHFNIGISDFPFTASNHIAEDL